MEIAEAVNLSHNACWRRMKRLEESGVVRRTVALLDPKKVGLNLTVLVSVRTNDHSAEWTQRFADMVGRMPEVVELWRLSGEIDYLLKVLVEDVAGYDAVYKRLIQVGGLFDVSSSFAMECVKSTTALPLPSPA